MTKRNKTTLILHNADIVGDIGEALRSGIELVPSAHTEMDRITREDEGATLSDMALLNAVGRVRELEKQVKQLNEGKRDYEEVNTCGNYREYRSDGSTWRGN
ncbi:hypothetical protein ACQ3VH_15975 [Bacillus pretiosus]|uniref:hypothetical protein n=1 Tax=Bacillus pretiosus TaxID=2983392 RepID=UPI002ED7C1B4